MDTTSAALARTAAQAALILVAAPLVPGVVQRLKARLQCRRGASV